MNDPREAMKDTRIENLPWVPMTSQGAINRKKMVLPGEQQILPARTGIP